MCAKMGAVLVCFRFLSHMSFNPLRLDILLWVPMQTMMTNMKCRIAFHQGLHCGSSEKEIQYFLEFIRTCDPSIYIKRMILTLLYITL